MTTVWPRCRSGADGSNPTFTVRGAPLRRYSSCSCGGRNSGRTFKLFFGIDLPSARDESLQRHEVVLPENADFVFLLSGLQVTEIENACQNRACNDLASKFLVPLPRLPTRLSDESLH